MSEGDEYIMLDLSCILLEGTILSVVMLVTLYYNPRIWLHDYPKDIQHIAKGRTKKETRQFYYITIFIKEEIKIFE
ncbi:hypothetical protein KOY_00811 [Bacillus cereus VDM021]|uniref:Uncharacterized protein n=1 Tax=Bacillus pseudomycoides TaxID=64104 RepID=A0A1Y3M915_9BACI|nr:hypothetical protein IIW_02487 [Bacillus cereus VD136]EOP67516.1 hypothetical protein KOW_04163 [Bacillus cereus VDM006]EOQ02961.1 hypothetical protein KOY_00811 [Bacillus cereus VDM021]OUM46586.1 hypothetical protein BW425_22785 [Bacillus pseudomycoides]PEK60598.1 hypothetical protein CN590_24010 [Bacillus pseudomycoides]